MQLPSNLARVAHVHCNDIATYDSNYNSRSLQSEVKHGLSSGLQYPIIIIGEARSNLVIGCLTLGWFLNCLYNNPKNVEFNLVGFLLLVSVPKAYDVRSSSVPFVSKR